MAVPQDGADIAKPTVQEPPAGTAVPTAQVPPHNVALPPAPTAVGATANELGLVNVQAEPEPVTVKTTPICCTTERLPLPVQALPAAL